MGFKNDEWVEFEGVIEQPTAKAVLFRADNWDEAYWIPRSQMEIVKEEETDDGKRFTLHIKKWLVEKNAWPQ